MKERNKDIKGKKEERGSILVMSLLITTVFLIMTVPFLFQLSTENRLSEKSHKSLAAISLAEAGVERAIWELNHGDIETWKVDGDSRLSSFSLESGEMDVKVDLINPLEVAVLSTGLVEYIGDEVNERTVRIDLQRRESYPFKYGLYGKDRVEIQTGAETDAYYSENGAYGGDNLYAEGNVVTGSTATSAIHIQKAGSVRGDAFVGVDGDPETGVLNEGTIEGVMGALEAPVELPSVAVPSDLPILGSFWGEVGILDQSGVYDEFVLGSEANVSIEGDVVLVITDRFYMDNGSHVTIEEGSSLTIYMVDTASVFYVDQGASVNNRSEDATKMMLYATDGYLGEVEIDQTTTYYGGVYTPNASIYLDNSTGFFGAAVGREVELDMNSKFHYDMSLDLFGITDKDAPYVVKSWHEVVH